MLSIFKCQVTLIIFKCDQVIAILALRDQFRSLTNVRADTPQNSVTETALWFLFK